MSRPSSPEGSFNDAPVPTLQTVDEYIGEKGAAYFAPKDATETALAGKADTATLGDTIAATTRKPQLIASACMVSYDTTATNTVGNSVVSRHVHKTAPVKVSDVRVGYHAFYLGGTTGPETDLANGFALQAALEPSGALAVAKATFNGLKSPTLDGEAGIVLSDTIGLTFDANTVLYSRTRTTPTGTTFAPFGRRNVSGSLNQNRTTISSDTNQVYSTGALSVGTSNGSGLTPAVIIGVPASPFPAHGIINDSIGNGSGDTDGTGIVDGGYWGFIGRGFQNSYGTGGVHPYTFLGKAGADLDSFLGVNGMRRLSLLQYCTYAHIQAVSNTLWNSGLTIADVKSRASQLFAAARQRGCRVVAYLPICRTDASNTPVSGFEPGGKRDQYCAWLLAGADGLIDDVIDVRSAVEDPANPGKWLPSLLPPDGVHPTTAGHVAMAAIVNAWARALPV